MKYVLVTGGVVSGLGKGVTASSIGVVLKACGLRVTSIKIGLFLPRFLRIFFSFIFVYSIFIFIFGVCLGAFGCISTSKLVLFGNGNSLIDRALENSNRIILDAFFPPGMQWMFGHPNGE